MSLYKIDLETCPYPYYYLSINEEKIKEVFRKLSKHEFKIGKRNKANRDIFFHVDLTNYKEIAEYLRITDYFSEEVRVRCQFADYPTPYDWFQKNRSKVIKALGKSKASFNNIDSYMWTRIKPCNNFPIMMAMLLYDGLKIHGRRIKRVLDPSAGWGDRLLGFMAYCYGKRGHFKYQGTDPNLAMQPCYHKMIETFGGKRKGDLMVTPKPFEKFVVEENYYDLVFTSPPFFTLEKYSSDSTQCNVAYNTLDKWLHNFLYPLIEKAERALVLHGYLALYISDFKNVKYVERTKNFIRDNTYFWYQGDFTWCQTKHRRNIMVWRKVEHKGNL